MYSVEIFQPKPQINPDKRDDVFLL